MNLNEQRARRESSHMGSRNPQSVRFLLVVDDGRQVKVGQDCLRRSFDTVRQNSSEKQVVTVSKLSTRAVSRPLKLLKMQWWARQDSNLKRTIPRGSGACQVVVFSVRVGGRCPCHTGAFSWESCTSLAWKRPGPSEFSLLTERSPVTET